jgi:hypothetical protein
MLLYYNYAQQRPLWAWKDSHRDISDTGISGKALHRSRVVIDAPNGMPRGPGPLTTALSESGERAPDPTFCHTRAPTRAIIPAMYIFLRLDSEVRTGCRSGCYVVRCRPSHGYSHGQWQRQVVHARCTAGSGASARKQLALAGQQPALQVRHRHHCWRFPLQWHHLLPLGTGHWALGTGHWAARQCVPP